MRKVKFIYNPFSGEKEILKYLDYLIYSYQKKSFTVIPYRLGFDRDISEAFADIDDTFDHILISGGDGTVNEVVNGMKKLNIDLPIGVIPAGTANDFAHLIGMPQSIRYSIDAILNSEVSLVDLGKANDKYFVNIFSCGLFTDVSQKTPTEYKNTFGKLAYYFTGIKELPKFKTLDLSIKSKNFNYEGSSILFFVFNGRTAGNLEVAHDSTVDDGYLDVIIIPADNILEKLSILPHLLNKNNTSYPKGIIHFKTDEIEIDVKNSNEYTTDIDGEQGPKFPIKITCEKNSLKVLGWI
ncbi:MULTISPECIES: YegS/Rv2252/BmrU family lipid kinase [Fusobacterium]|uniref:YegS/Rv2252/BmrU family lipid kinase n=1 Tax=Fusobacterium TaxID=848 RepID=UPI0015A61793|nr:MULTISPECIES: YegS/Rv2252/BmrU family lipid kinase [Fusobacterium]MCF2612649.1 YegS/Rv2252/BmrU family lipid kinase [Fusobacterium perfoetens]MDY2980413.1 YegS/Rv2252/BmrU family lipid kinase [Fusobacterium sp.]